MTPSQKANPYFILASELVGQAQERVKGSDNFERLLESLVSLMKERFSDQDFLKSNNLIDNSLEHIERFERYAKRQHFKHKYIGVLMIPTYFLLGWGESTQSMVISMLFMLFMVLIAVFLPRRDLLRGYLGQFFVYEMAIDDGKILNPKRFKWYMRAGLGVVILLLLLDK